jgi:hypothetical protein
MLWDVIIAMAVLLFEHDFHPMQPASLSQTCPRHVPVITEKSQVTVTLSGQATPAYCAHHSEIVT